MPSESARSTVAAIGRAAECGARAEAGVAAMIANAEIIGTIRRMLAGRVTGSFAEKRGRQPVENAVVVLCGASGEGPDRQLQREE